MSKEKEKIPSILDEIKKVEKITKRNLLLKQLVKIKKLSKEILEDKKKCELLLQEIGIKSDDIKKVIDFVNNLPEVQLSEEDIRELKREIKGKVVEEKKDVEEKIIREMERDPALILNTPSSYISTTTASSVDIMGGTTGNVFLCSSSGDELKIKM